MVIGKETVTWSPPLATFLKTIDPLIDFTMRETIDAPNPWPFSPLVPFQESPLH